MFAGSKVVATLRADGNVYPTNTMDGLANLLNYKIRTENEIAAKSLSTVSVPVVDLGKQLLQYARDSDLKGVKNMLSRGAPFTADWLGMSALHFAAMNDQYEICDVLLKGGINKDSKTKVDRTPLHLACFYGNERIVDLLLSKNCAVNPRDMLRMTPLHWAVEKGYKSIVRTLLKHDADVSLVSKFGKTPIALAVQTEQADLLEELEAARKSQANQKYDKEHEKETSDAVNSIVGLKSDIIIEPENISKMDVDTEDDLTNTINFDESKMADLKNIKETGMLDNTTIDLLKSHGISMMQDDDDTSKDLLNTALQNGRQLVLSEGGKLLLNEAKRNLNNNTNSYNKNNNNNSNATSIPCIKTEIVAPTRTPTLQRANVVSKVKDNTGIGRNKNIRIISLNDFKKLYGNTNLKAMQKLPASLANTRMIRQLATNTKLDNAERRVYTNLRQIQNRQFKTESDTDNADNLIEEVDQLPNIIQITHTDSEAEASDAEQHIKAASAPVRILPSRQLTGVFAGKQQTQHKIPIKVEAKQPQQQVQSNAMPLPLLTMSDVCRQLYELRKQHDELRRKFDAAQNEKAELQQRLERLEELLLVERADDDDFTDT